MRSGELAGSKFKRVSMDFPNLAILTKSATPGDIQATKDATVRDATDGIAADCDNILVFLQAVALKSL